MPRSKSDVHETPDRVYDVIKDIWGYEKEQMFDPCPIDGTDGLTRPWLAINYVNPPYSNLSDWVYRAIVEANDNACETIMLLPAKTDQEWFHVIIADGYQIKWIRGRLKFKNNKWSATQPHFLVMIK